MKPRKKYTPVTKEDWDKKLAEFPPGLYVMYKDGKEEEVNLRGWTETPCGTLGFVAFSAYDTGELITWCPGCCPNIRLELVKPLE